MRNPKFFCTQSCSRVKALVKQYNSIKDKQRPIDVDDSQPLKSEMRRLKLLAELIYADCDIIRALPDKILAVTAEWYQAIAEIEDETAQAAANLEYDNCQAATGWEDIGTIHCGHLTLLLDKAHNDADRHAEALAAKVAEAESLSYTDDDNGHQDTQGFFSADNAGNSRGGVNQPADNAGGFSDARNSGAPFGKPRGHFGPNATDRRKTHRFYRGIVLPPTASPESALAAAAAAMHLERPPCPVFDGQITEYNTFRDRFINVVEATGRNMTDRDKMAKLLPLLKGKPLRMCTGFPISDANYWRVLDLLADECDHQEELEQILLQQLSSLPTPGDRRHDLSEFYIDASRILRQLKDMGSDYNTRDVLQALQGKLPQHVLSSVLRAKKPGLTWNTAALMNRLHEEVQHAREIGRILQPGAYGAQEQPHTRHSTESTFGTAAFATRSSHTYYGSNSANRNPPADNAGGSGCCAFCDASSHPSARCIRFSTREQRLSRALYRGICPKCCTRQPRPHLAADCPHVDQGCYECRRSGHHLAFCITHLARFNDRLQRARPQNNFRKNPTRGRSPPPRRSYAAASNKEVPVTDDGDTADECDANPPLTEEEQRALDAELASDNESETDGSSRVGYSVLANQTNGNRHTKLLECTKAHVFNRDTGRSEDVVAFFDSGSDTSFVDQELADRLRLPDRGHDVFHVDTFASKGVKTRVPIMLTSIGVQLINGSTVDLEAKAGSGIIGHIHSALIDSKDVPLLRANKCAIIASSERPLLLIGRDQQHLFRKKDDEHPLPSGFCLVDTLLGPIIASTGTVKTVTPPADNAGVSPPSQTARMRSPADKCWDHTAAATAFRIIVDDCNSRSEDELAQIDENYWKTDNIGITLPEPGPEDELVFRRHRERLEPSRTTITEVTPWRGGTYERLIGPVKNCLRRSIGSGKPLLAREDFETLLIGAEALVNSRPLTHVPDTTNEYRVIRPKDFLIPMSSDDMRMDAFLPPPDETDGDRDYRPASVSNARDRVLALLQQADDKLHRFWELWREDYLAGLRERGYAVHSRRSSTHDRQPLVDEVVLVFADNAPRACWKLARVTELVTCADGQVRTARIRFANGHETRRATSHLYPLELTIAEATGPSTAGIPSRQCSGPPLPPGGFGPLTGLEEEAPEDPDTPTAEETHQQDGFAPIATRTRRRIATTKLVHWPEVLFDPGSLAQQTQQGGLNEDDIVSSA